MTKDAAGISAEIETLEQEIDTRSAQHEAFIKQSKMKLRELRSNLKDAKKTEPKERKPRSTEESPVVKKAVEVLEKGATRRELEKALEGVAKAGYVQSLLTGILAKKGYVLEATPDRRDNVISREKLYRIVGRR